MLDQILLGWFVLTALSTLFVGWDLYTRTPAMKLMKPGWVLVTLYTGIFGLILYVTTCRAPKPGYDAHDEYIKPTWRQAAGSMVHCLAGDATGVIAMAIILTWVEIPNGIEVILEYIAGFVVGLFVFQALFMKEMFGGYWKSVRLTFMSEWLSMNMVMAGMIPVMVGLMHYAMKMTANADGAMPAPITPLDMRYWGIMSVATIAGAILAYPMNYWLVANGIKHGMMTERPASAMGDHAAMGGMAMDQSAHGGHAMASSPKPMKMDHTSHGEHAGHEAHQGPSGHEGQGDHQGHGSHAGHQGHVEHTSHNEHQGHGEHASHGGMMDSAAPKKEHGMAAMASNAAPAMDHAAMGHAGYGSAGAPSSQGGHQGHGGQEGHGSGGGVSTGAMFFATVISCVFLGAGITIATVVGDLKFT